MIGSITTLLVIIFSLEFVLMVSWLTMNDRLPENVDERFGVVCTLVSALMPVAIGFMSVYILELKGLL